jgi:PKD repeat protein
MRKKDANWDLARKLVGELRQIAPVMLGDYYPLTPYSLTNTLWMAWQFDRPDTGQGVVQIFRRTNSAVPSMQFQLKGLNSAQLYDVQDFDRGDLGIYTGNQLMATGLTVQLAPQQSAILYYTSPATTASGAATPQGGLVPLAVQFSATGTSTNGVPLSYAWAFGDGGTATNQNPIYTYPTSGRYTAQVTVQDVNGNTATARIAISAYAPVRKMQLTFPGYNRAEILTNFPMLVVFGPNLLGNGFGYNQFASTNGWDLLFLDPTLTQELNYEIESWNPYGSSYIWVQVPQLATNTSIWACWGDPNRASVPAPCLTNGATWANGYESVWHLNEARGFARDSSPNLTVGVVYTTYGACTRGVAGEIANAYGFSGGYVSCSGATLPSGSNPRTVSAWFKKNAAATASPGKEIFGYGNNTTGQRFGLWIGGNGTANALGVENCGAGRTFPWSWDGQWHQLAAVLPSGQSDLSGVQLYYDGSLNNSATGQSPLNTAQDELCLAALPTFHTTNRVYDFDGSLDEVRISKVARSTNWVWAEWVSAASSAVFTSYGPVLAIPAPPFQVTQMALLPGNQFALAWGSANGRVYAVEGCTNLVPGISWTALATNLPGMGGVTSWTGKVGQATEFLRVRLQQ